MTGKQMFLEAELKWVGAIRRSSKIELIAAAAEREQQIRQELDGLAHFEPLAVSFAARDDDANPEG